MGIITYEEVYRTDGFNVTGLVGTARLTFEAAYDITKVAFDKGLENGQRKTGRQYCKKAILAMLKDAIERLEGGEE